MKSLFAIWGLLAGFVAVTPATAQLSLRTGALGGNIGARSFTRPLGGATAGFAGYGANRFSRAPSRAPLYRGYPYAYSVWVPDYFDSLNDQSQYAAPQYGPASDAYGNYGPPPPPPVIVNQYFGVPANPQQASAAPDPSASNTQAPGDPIGPPRNYYLIAYKNHEVYTALAYWVEDKTLHYVTTQNTHNQASLDLIDLALTKSLNQHNDVPFAIPGQPQTP